MFERIAALCDLWQSRLALRDWNVVVEFAPYEEIQGWGNIEWSLAQKSARIRLMFDSDKCAGACALVEYDVETTLVHELLHLHFAPFAADPETIEEICQEQAINAIANALIKLQSKMVYEQEAPLKRS